MKRNGPPKSRSARSGSLVDTTKWEKLLQSRGIRERSEALIFGNKVALEMNLSLKGTGRALGWIGTSAMRSECEIATTAAKTAYFEVPVAGFEKLDIFGTRSPILWIQIPQFGSHADFVVERGEIGLVIPFQNPENVGALLRSAVAFGVSKVLLTKECAHPFHPKSVRSASGALYKTSFFVGPELGDLDISNGEYVGLSAEGTGISTFAWPHGGILVPGIEGPGLPKTLRERLRLVSIPMANDVESLNGMVASSLALYEWRQFLTKAQR